LPRDILRLANGREGQRKISRDGACEPLAFLNSRCRASLGCAGRHNKKQDVEMIMKYFVAMCLLAAPLAMSVAPTPAEAGYRDHYRCHFVKKTVWRFGKKRVKLVKVCKQPRFAFHRRHR
jgi:hypothetical protein